MEKLSRIRKVSSKRKWAVHGYCLLRNHYHLVLQISDPDLSAGMQRINSAYAQWFNRNYGFVGHVFEDVSRQLRSKAMVTSYS